MSDNQTTNPEVTAPAISDIAPAAAPQAAPQVPFKSVQELMDHNEKMRLQIQQYDQLLRSAQLGQQTTATHTAPASTGIKDIGDMWWENPAEAVNKLKSDFDKEVDKKLQQKEYERNFWESFYTSNPDLRQFKDEVNSIASRNMKSWYDLPTDEAAKKLSASTRDYIKSVRDRMTDGKPMPERGSDVTLGATHQEVQMPVLSPEDAAGVSFVDQIKSLRRKATMSS
jgi:hypothetical protein